MKSNKINIYFTLFSQFNLKQNYYEKELFSFVVQRALER
jgi:hypothetical protein